MIKLLRKINEKREKFEQMSKNELVKICVQHELEEEYQNRSLYEGM